MDYQSTLQYLYGLTDYEKERIARYDPDTLDLSRVVRVLGRLGDPHRRFPSVHIAGTKGKGSVAALCESVLRAAGLRTGLYTSPHLHTFRERIRVDGELISEQALTALVEECRSVFDTEPELTTFEAITALAFLHFVRRQVDYAGVEVGLGGRLDATNVITPQVAVITSLSYDHTYLLGDTLAEIAGEKAGIIKPGVPTVCAPQEPEALAVIEQVCAERGSPLTLVGRDWTWQLPASASDLSKAQNLPFELESQTFELCRAHDPSSWDGTYTVPLLGRHQLNNAALAVAALDLLRGEGVPLRLHHLRRGLVNVRWPGRFEILRRDPPLVVDCAHNGDSVSKLVAALEEWFPGRRWTFILGASSDKDVPGMLGALAPLADRVLATQARHSRAMPSHEVAALAVEILSQAGASRVQVEATDDVGAALRLAIKRDNQWHASSHSTPGGGKPVAEENVAPICVTGSIFAVADAREVWALYTGKDLPEADHPMTYAMLPLGDDSTGQTETLIL